MPGLDSMCHNIYRWERGEDGLSERYKLYCCRALGIPPGQFGPGQPDGQPAAAYTPGTITLAFAPGLPAAPLFTQAPYLVPGLADPALLPPVAVAYRGIQEPDMGDSAVRREVLMAAHEGSDHAEQAEQHGIGDATLEQLRADVARLSREYMTGEPFPLFLDMRRVRSRMHDALDRRVWPGDASRPVLPARLPQRPHGDRSPSRLGYPQRPRSCARRLGVRHRDRPPAADGTLARCNAASNVFWEIGQAQARDLAADGLRLPPCGPNAAYLHVKYARAAARLGDADGARQAIAEARDAREREHSRRSCWRSAGSSACRWPPSDTWPGRPSLRSRARNEKPSLRLERAVELYDAGPGPGKNSTASR